ncbi:MAG: CDP-diacylglycerol--serine O-phosphatidyltransferase [Silicimonas sp.]|nr:CDP-diacylglycerol--serine O-phosphatidyltransferase [Silicimonas sp.]
MRAPQQPTSETSDSYPLSHQLPNLLTLAAICAGLTAIRSAVTGDFAVAVQLILVACLLDGLDGRLARRMGSASKLGAELDSLADFLNFGVATPLVIYFWALHEMENAAWLAVLIFTVCCVLRLARFNIASKSEAEIDMRFFEGLPSPAGAILVMMPLYIAFAFPEAARIPGYAICFYMIGIGLLLVSRIPTWSFKTTRVSRHNLILFLIGSCLVGLGLLTYAWITLIVLCLGYATIVTFSIPRKVHPSLK